MGPSRASLIRAFLQQKSPEEWFAEEILRCVREPHLLDPNLRKAVLLRRLIPNVADARLSEDTLQCLELIEELDRNLGAPPPKSVMCAAYCAVAAELTVAPLRRGSVEGFLEAANWIWECRVGDLEQSEGRWLLGEGIWEWRDAIREAVKSEEARDGVLKRDIRLEALGEYLDVAVNEMEHPLLQLVARAAGAEQCNAGHAEECTTSGSDEDADRTISGSDEDADRSSEERLGPAGHSGVSSERSDPAGACTEELAQVGSPTSPIGTDGGSAPVPEAERNETDELAGQVTEDTTYQTYELSTAMPSVEVNKVRETLHSCCEDLQKAVTDPLPDALIKADSVQMDMVDGSTNPNDSRENANQTGASVAGSSFQKDAQDTIAERNADGEHDGIPCPSVQQHDVVATTEDTTYQTYELSTAMPSVEVNNVRETLHSCCEDLRKVVTDPLPDALIKADSVQMDMVEGSTNPNDSCENANQTAASVPGSSFQKDAQDTIAERNANGEHDGIPCPSVQQHDVVATTACPDEDAEGSSECPSGNSTNSSKGTRMSTRNHGGLSPALQGVSKFIRRRNIKRWTPLQEDTLIKAVKRHGKGNWKVILQSYPQIFEDRTEIDLKDKWRNMSK